MYNFCIIVLKIYPGVRLKCVIFKKIVQWFLIIVAIAVVFL